MDIVYSLAGIDYAAKKFSELVGSGKVITFSGGMGAGKTTFIQAFCRLMGVTETMGSPTFSIINEYENGPVHIYHIDLYRCKDEEEAIRAGVEDCLYSGNMCLVEWPEKAPSLFPEESVRVRITEVDKQSRMIEFL